MTQPDLTVNIWCLTNGFAIEMNQDQVYQHPAFVHHIYELVDIISRYFGVPTVMSESRMESRGVPVHTAPVNMVPVNIPVSVDAFTTTRVRKIVADELMDLQRPEPVSESDLITQLMEESQTSLNTAHADLRERLGDAQAHNLDYSALRYIKGEEDYETFLDHAHSHFPLASSADLQLAVDYQEVLLQEEIRGR